MKRLRKCTLLLIIAMALIVLNIPSIAYAGSYELSGYKEMVHFEETVYAKDLGFKDGYVKINLDDVDSYFDNIEVTINKPGNKEIIKKDNTKEFSFYLSGIVSEITLSGDAILYKDDANINFNLSELGARNIKRNIKRTNYHTPGYSAKSYRTFEKVEIHGKTNENIVIEPSNGFLICNPYETINGAFRRIVTPERITLTMINGYVYFEPILKGEGSPSLKIQHEDGSIRIVDLKEKIAIQDEPNSKIQSKDSITINTVAPSIKKDTYNLNLNRVEIAEKSPGQLTPGQIYGICLPDESTMTFESAGKFTSKNTSLKNVRIHDDKKVIMFEVAKVTDKKEASIFIDDLKIDTNTDLLPREYKIDLVKLIDRKEINFFNNPNFTFSSLEDGDKEYILNLLDSVSFTTVSKDNESKTEFIFNIGDKIYLVNGFQNKLDAAPFIKNDYTMLPLRVVGETLGLTVDWIDDTKTATIVGENGELLLIQPGKQSYRKNGRTIKMPTKAILKEDRIFLPISVIAEAFDLERDKDFFWDPVNYQVIFSIRDK